MSGTGLAAVMLMVGIVMLVILFWRQILNLYASCQRYGFLLRGLLHFQHHFVHEIVSRLR